MTITEMLAWPIAEKLRLWVVPALAEADKIAGGEK